MVSRLPKMNRYNRRPLTVNTIHVWEFQWTDKKYTLSFIVRSLQRGGELDFV